MRPLPDRVYKPARPRRRKRTRTRLLWQWLLLAVTLLVLSGAGLGIAFAGSPETLPAGTSVAGVDVSGLTPLDARRMLERRAKELDRVPVRFTSSGRSWEVKPTSLLIETDWAAAVESARRQGEGFGPFRGLRRIGVRVFGADIVPRTHVSEAALDYTVNRFAKQLDQPRVEPAIRLRGLEPQITPGTTGRVLDRDAAARVIVRSLAAFSRRAVPLPVRIDRPQLTEQALTQPQARVRTILSAPVNVAYGPGGWRLPRWRLAQMLELPKDGSTAIRIAGPAATKFFAAIQKTVDRPAQDATFEILSGNRVRVVAAKRGFVLDAAPTARSILDAALRPASRVARVAVRSEAPEVTTKEAQGMGVTGLVGAYETTYGGEANRLHNVRLVARLIDGTLIAPGTTFSFNGTTGERSEEKGFLEAPVIINGELQTGLGGGVCQVSTTVFNAAYEAGLPIGSRTNHALYISHYPLGRDATVNYPDIDLKFTNDTGRWLFLKTFVGSSSLTVALYGSPQNRRVESKAAPLVVRGPAPVKQVSDPSIFVGSRVVAEAGSPARSTSVRRKVYSSSGKLLYDDSWSSSYRGEYQVIRVGTKPKPKPPPSPDRDPKKKNPKPPPPPPAEPPPPRPPADPPPPPPL
jgi:vancomycin resistance protein YoaR